MNDGKTMWDALCYKYDLGVQQVREYQKVWDRMEQYIDYRRFEEVQIQIKDTGTRCRMVERCLFIVFPDILKKSLSPMMLERPIYELDDLKKIKLDMKHHN
jgi:Glycosyl hydrolase family 67 C-terminus.